MHGVARSNDPRRTNNICMSVTFFDPDGRVYHVMLFSPFSSVPPCLAPQAFVSFLVWHKCPDFLECFYPLLWDTATPSSWSFSHYVDAAFMMGGDRESLRSTIVDYSSCETFDVKSGKSWERQRILTSLLLVTSSRRCSYILVSSDLV